MTARLYIGDAIEILSGDTIPDGSVDLALTSPPFLALRSYLPADHPDKAKEIGGEPTPGEFIDTMLHVVELLAPKLAPHGSICIELGDTYAGSGGAGGDYNEGGLREGQERFDGSASKAFGTGSAPRPPRRNADYSGDGWPDPKSLCMIPELLRVALAYGINPLTGRTTERWRCRNVIRWCRPNPPVGSLFDKVRPATSDMLVACKDRHRFFDLDAIRNDNPRVGERYVGRRLSHAGDLNRPDKGASPQNEKGSPPLDHWWYDDTFRQDAWMVSTQGYRGAHYAVWPEALLIKPIEAMCPRRVCRTCGKPSQRITEDVLAHVRTISEATAETERSRINEHQANRPNAQVPRDRAGDRASNRSVITTGWTDCGHDNWRPGVVLDPFAGTGTTGVVATGHGRDAILIDLDARNEELVRERIGMFLEVAHPSAQGGLF